MSDLLYLVGRDGFLDVTGVPSYDPGGFAGAVSPHPIQGKACRRMQLSSGRRVVLRQH